MAAVLFLILFCVFTSSIAYLDQYEILLIELFFLGLSLDIFQNLTRISVGEQIWP